MKEQRDQRIEARGASRRSRDTEGRPAETPRPLGDLAAAALKDLAGTERSDLVEVLTVWRDVVGERIAGTARPRRLAGGILTLEVTSPVWSQQLVLMARELVAAVNERVGREIVRDLRFCPAKEAR